MPQSPYTAAALVLCLAASMTEGPAQAQEPTLAPREQFGQVVVTAKQIGAGGPQFEQAFGGEFDSEPAYRINANSTVRQLARAVGRLDVLFPQGTGYCTAFLISETQLMTNAHCLSAGTPQSISFTTGYVEFGVADGTETYMVNPVPMEVSPPDDLDFAILEVFGYPSRTWGKLELAAETMDSTSHAGWPLLVIGHPIFETAPVPVPNSQYISRKECQAAQTNAVTGNRLRHTCDTLPGNSGSPVLGDDSRKVIALHHAGDSREGINFAIPIALIAQQSKIVAALIAASEAPQAAAPQPEPTALNACDATLARVQASQDCADVEAYLAACDGHAMMPFVQSFAQTLCKAAEAEQTLEERMAADPVVQQCDALAGSPDHPDRQAGLMSGGGIAIGDIVPDAAIATCEAALTRFPDHPRLLTNLGRAFFKEDNDSEAVATLRKAALLNDPMAQFNLGFMTETGRGVAQSDTDAAAWYRQAAEQGLTNAQVNLGLMYLKGRGVSQSETDALTWFRKAAEQGDVDVQFNLGWMFSQGLDVTKSDTDAVEWYRKAAEQGHISAQFNLGVMYQYGRGVAQSGADAFAWYRKAAEQGHANAQFNIGWMYENGRGVPQSDADALTWYRNAAEQGHASAQDRVADLSK